MALETETLYISGTKETAAERVKEVLKYRTLLWSLALRDIRVRYKQSLLGVVWALAVPLATMLLFSFVFTQVVPLKTDIPYPIFAYCGILPWQLFAASTAGATNSLIANRSLVTKIYFPAEVFPLSSIIAALVDFAVGGLILVGMMIFFALNGASITVSWTILLFPVVLAVQLLFTMGIGFLLAMGNVFFSDVRYVYGIGITLWMFASSVVYPMKTEDPTMQLILSLNPITPILDAYRDVLLRGKLPDPLSFGYAAFIGFVVCVIGWNIFRRMQYRFAEKA